MRMKDIPEDIEKLASNKYVLIGGAAIVVVVGLMYFSSQSANAASSSGSGTAGLSSYGYSPVSTGLSDVTPTSALGSSSASLDPSVAAALGLQGTEDSQNFQVAMASLAANANATIAAQTTNLQIAQLGLLSSQYQASSAVTTAFINSGENLLAGAVTPTVNGGLAVDLVQQVQGSNWYTKTLGSGPQILSGIIAQTATAANITNASNATQSSSTGSTASSSSGQANTTTGQYSPSTVAGAINAAVVAGSGRSALGNFA